MSIPKIFLFHMLSLISSIILNFISFIGVIFFSENVRFHIFNHVYDSKLNVIIELDISISTFDKMYIKIYKLYLDS